MGISGLLQALSPVFNDAHVKQFKGKKVAIDGYVWLHKGSYACAMDLCLNKPTRKYITYVLKRVEMLKHYGVIPVVVFDGSKLEGKEITNNRRREKRRSNIEEGKEMLLQAEATKPGPTKQQLMRKAEELFQRASTVSKAMVRATCAALRKKGVETLIAPFEADPQLVYLSKIGHCEAIITEDSDLIVFAIAQGLSNCQLIYKLDQYGNCKLFNAQSPKELHKLYQSNTQKKSKFLASLNQIDNRGFVQTCILSGCDYIEKVDGVGLRKAQDIVIRSASAEPNQRIRRILKILEQSKQATPAGYIEQFQRAEALFHHQCVYDPRSVKLTNLSPLYSTTSLVTSYSFSCTKFLGQFDDAFTDAELLERAKGVRNWTDRTKSIPSTSISTSSDDIHSWASQSTTVPKPRTTLADFFKAKNGGRRRPLSSIQLVGASKLQPNKQRKKNKSSILYYLK